MLIKLDDAIASVQDNLAFSVKAHIIEALRALPVSDGVRNEALEEAAKLASEQAVKLMAQLNGTKKRRSDHDIAVFESAASEANAIAQLIRELKDMEYTKPDAAITTDMLERARKAVIESANWRNMRGIDEGSPLWGEKVAHAALEAALGATVSDGWEDIATAPRDGTLVLLFEPHSEGGFAFVGCNNLGAEWFNNLDMKEQNPTHWKPLGPLPAPPAC